VPVIHLQTRINAPVRVVFNLARSIDLHKISTAHTNEEAIAGTTTGLINMGESVTWRAKHFGITQTLTSTITAYNEPYFFTDEMAQGIFKSFKHDHIFTEENGVVIMKDVFTYQSPFGILGHLADVLFLKRYMANLLTERNRIVKQFAENAELYSKVLPL
jgi:ligand-binding SRPBCC domain-containing protein